MARPGLVRDGARVRFRDRREAGRLLGERLLAEGIVEPAIRPDAGPGERGSSGEPPIVLGLPRGGVPVAYEVARALGAPLDVLVVRKLGVPWHPELGMGAVGEEGITVLNDDVVRTVGVQPERVAEVERRERDEVQARAGRFRRGRPPLPITGRTVIIVDDGLATGGTARAAIAVARARGAARVVLAVPVAPSDASAILAHEADAFVCLVSPAQFSAVGSWYGDFRQTSDDEVMELLDAAT